MNEYRFHLANYKLGVKVSCPHCGKPKCFTPYIDEEGIVSFPDVVGICDHVNSCGYHYPPRQYFQDHPELSEKESMSNLSKVIIVSRPSVAVSSSYIDQEILQQTLKRYDINPLFQFLCSRFGKKASCRLFETYKVGTSKHWNGSTIFWQIDNRGCIRSGKVMDYDPATGHRIKGEQPRVCWVHSLLHLQNFHLCQCLFGEHLLSRFPYSKVAIVESEKTAIIASNFFPQYLWLATGGIMGKFKPEVMEVLRGREVFLFPDLKGYEKWSEQASVLEPICKSVTVLDILERMATQDEREQGLDLADYLMRDETKEQILQKVIDQNPAVQMLIDVFDLELVDAFSVK